MIAGVALGCTAVALVAAMVATRQRPAAVPSLDGYLSGWSALHEGYDPRSNRWVRATLGVAFAAARPLVRRGVHPDVLTLWGVWLGLAAYVVAGAGGRWPLVAGAVLAGAGFADALDGAVAAMTGRATRWGFVLDSLADRVTEVLALLAVWVVGAPGGLVVACGVAFGLLEYLRARAANAGMEGIGVVTVGERPVRIVLCVAALVGAGAAVGHAPAVAGLALAVLAALSAVALAQLLAVTYRELATPQGEDRRR
ncbi:MAG TPA: CDP-alcohol phosphatidyltransferase family protein [Egibacteraceae bacterium]|nr:CDP-alcohol phosphatidyltransferase family protein [Egibacteraceae bacterium]